MRKSLALALVLMVAFAVNVFAVGEARLTGKVVGPDGTPVADAKITVTALSGKTFKKTFTTNDKGEYAIFLIDGTIRYEFLFEKEGLGGYKEEMKLKLIPEKNFKDVTLGAPVAASGGMTTGVAKPDPAVIAYNEGAEAANAGNDDLAIAKFKEAIGLKSDLTAAHIALAKMYAKKSDWANAITEAEVVIAIDPEDPDMNSILATGYEKTGNKAKAAEYKKKAPASPRGLFNDAAKFINAGNASAAEPLLRQAVQLDPEFAQAHYELGMLLAGMSKNAEAREHLNKYLELEPKGKDAATAKEMLNYVK